MKTRTLIVTDDDERRMIAARLDGLDSKRSRMASRGEVATLAQRLVTEFAKGIEPVAAPDPLAGERVDQPVAAPSREPGARAFRPLTLTGCESVLKTFHPRALALIDRLKQMGDYKPTGVIEADGKIIGVVFANGKSRQVVSKGGGMETLRTGSVQSMRSFGSES